MPSRAVFSRLRKLHALGSEGPLVFRPSSTGNESSASVDVLPTRVGYARTPTRPARSRSSEQRLGPDGLRRSRSTARVVLVVLPADRFPLRQLKGGLARAPGRAAPLAREVPLPVLVPYLPATPACYRRARSIQCFGAGVGSVSLASAKLYGNIRSCPIRRTALPPRAAFTAVGLFASIGGLELGFQRAGASSKLLCEVWAPPPEVLREGSRG